MRRKIQLGLICALALAATFSSALHAADMADAHGAFAQLKSLAGSWAGSPEGSGEAEAEAEMAGKVIHEFRVSAAGTVVMETMGPGTDQEMINMYYLDGEELVLTHYCAAGNQPTMRLNRENSTEGKLVFDFTGGTNLDPSVDQHIHAAEIEWMDDDHVRSAWTGYAGGEQAGIMTFDLARQGQMAE